MTISVQKKHDFKNTSQPDTVVQGYRILRERVNTFGVYYVPFPQKSSPFCRTNIFYLPPFSTKRNGSLYYVLSRILGSRWIPVGLHRGLRPRHRRPSDRTRNSARRLTALLLFGLTRP